MTQQMGAECYERAERLLTLHRSKLVAGGKVKPRWIEHGARFWYRSEGPQGHEHFIVDPQKGTRQPVSPVEVEPHTPADPLEAQSPDGKWAVFRRDHDLWIRSLEAGDEHPLTSDGAPDCSYGSPVDCLSFGILLRQYGLPYFPPIVAWSPDSKRLITHRTDQRDVRLQYLLEAVPPDGGPSQLHTYRYANPGDEVMPRVELIVFDVETRTAVAAKTDPLLMPVVSPIMFRRVWWSADGSAVYFLRQPRNQKALQLQRLDAATGEVRALVEESGEPWIEPGQFTGDKPVVRVLSSEREVLWYSERDGWGHLYLYDIATGELRARVTSGNWGVREILHVDESRRIVYFVASGLVAADPYCRQVCRVNLDGSGFARLSNDDLDHIVTVPPNEAYYIDSASLVDTPPAINVCGWDGHIIVELERADISRLLETGWTPPERFCVKAADGQTDIYGILYRPYDFDPDKKYPVIDHPYPGPHVHRAHPCFGEPRPLYDPESLASLGFVVVAVDGRGTPGRSRAFHEMAYGHYDKAGFLEDHVAAFRQLAKSRPWMDLGRVGVFGSSGGGYATLRAMCAHPDFYKVGISLCGNHEQRYYQLSWGESYLGLPAGNEDAYLRSSNVEIADRLQGKLLLIHGEMDDNVHPHHTLRVVDRLIAANKDFELLIVPGAEHLFIGYLPYITRRKWDFFVRHLLGAEPPAGYRLADTRPTFESLFG